MRSRMRRFSPHKQGENLIRPGRFFAWPRAKPMERSVSFFVAFVLLAARKKAKLTAIAECRSSSIRQMLRRLSRCPGQFAQ